MASQPSPWSTRARCRVSRGEEACTQPLQKFWQPFIDLVEVTEKSVSREEVAQARELGMDPSSGRPVSVRMGRIGPFVQAGTKENVIPDEAIIKLNVRTFDEGVRKRVLAAIERIVNAEAAASGAPKKPEITPLDRYSLVTNDPEATKRVGDAFRLHFPVDRVQETKPTTASEDFGSFGTQWGVPSVFWYVGGTDPDAYHKAEQAGRVAQDIPTNHNPRFAPVIHPTLETGVQAITTAALDALGAERQR